MMVFEKSELIDVEKGLINKGMLLLFVQEVKRALNDGKVIKISLTLSKYNFKSLDKYTEWLDDVLKQYHDQIEEQVKSVGFTDNKCSKLFLTLEADLNIKELEDIRKHKGVLFLETHSLIANLLKEKVIKGGWLSGVYIDQEGGLVLVLDW
jgi:hypothetical protein